MQVRMTRKLFVHSAEVDPILTGRRDGRTLRSDSSGYSARGQSIVMRKSGSQPKFVWTVQMTVRNSFQVKGFLM